MQKVVQYLGFALKCVVFGMMLVLFGYNIVLIWNSNNYFKVELIVCFCFLIGLCLGGIYGFWRELHEKEEDKL